MTKMGGHTCTSYAYLHAVPAATFIHPFPGLPPDSAPLPSIPCQPLRMVSKSSTLTCLERGSLSRQTMTNSSLLISQVSPWLGPGLVCSGNLPTTTCVCLEQTCPHAAFVPALPASPRHCQSLTHAWPSSSSTFLGIQLLSTDLFGE
jgi:hypothetical protein